MILTSRSYLYQADCLGGESSNVIECILGILVGTPAVAEAAQAVRPGISELNERRTPTKAPFYAEGRLAGIFCSSTFRRAR